MFWRPIYLPVFLSIAIGISGISLLLWGINLGEIRKEIYAKEPFERLFDLEKKLWADKQSLIQSPAPSDLSRSIELLDPLQLAPSGAALLLKPYLVDNADDCKKTRASRAHPKLSMWRDFICFKKKLPHSFWKMDPLIYPLGGSWAHRASNDNTLLWHILEIKKEKHVEGYSLLYPWEKAFIDIPPALQVSLLNAKDFAKSNGKVLFLLDTSGNNVVFSLLDEVRFIELLREEGLRMDENAETNCPAFKGGLCFRHKLEPLENQQRILNFLTGLWIIFLALLICLLFWERGRIQRQLKDEQNIIIRNFVHEIRHVAQSFNFLFDRWAHAFNGLPEKIKEDIGSFSQYNERLKETLESSDTYLLFSSQSKNILRSQFKSVDFVEWLESHLEEFDQKIQYLKASQGSLRIRTEPYWLAIVIRNIVRNALSHGKPPVSLTYERQVRTVRIIIRDGGDGIDGGLESAATTLKKGPGSQGLGLGLNLIVSICEAINAKVSYQKKPSTFFVEVDIDRS